MKGQPRSRPAPTIGQRVVVKLVPAPESIRQAQLAMWRYLIGRVQAKAGAA